MRCSRCGEGLSLKSDRGGWSALFSVEGRGVKECAKALDRGEIPEVIRRYLEKLDHPPKREVLVYPIQKSKRWRVEAAGGNVVVKRTGKERLDVFFWDRKTAREEVRKLPAIVVRDGGGPSAICRKCVRGERP